MSAYSDHIISVLTAHNGGAYWRRGDPTGTTAADSSGAGRNATYFVNSSPVAGLIALDADGCRQDVGQGITHASWMDCDKISLECWLEMDASQTNKGVLSRFAAGSNWLIWINVSGQIAVRFYNEAGSQVDLAWTGTPTGDKRYVVATYESGSAKLYVDNVLVASSAALTGNLRKQNCDIQVGAYQGGFGFDGKIDEAVVYIDYVLTTDDMDVTWTLGDVGIVAPGEPENVVVVPGSDTADASWEEPSTGGDVDNYDVRLNGGTITDVGLDLTYQMTGLSPHATYDSPGFEVRACNGGGCSDWVAVPFTTEFPPVVTSHYEVTIDGGPPVSVTELCEAFDGLEPGTDYEVCVRACNDTCCSEYVCLTVTTAPPPQAWSVCPCGPGWRIEVCNLATGVIRGVLMPTAMDFQVEFNTVGRGTLTLPVQTVRALDVWPDLTSVYITRLGMDPANDDCLFAGIVRKATGSNGTVSVGMDSIESYLWRRRLQRDLSFSDIGQNQIMAALVAETVANGIPLTGVAETPGPSRNRDYLAADRAYIGPLLEQFTNSEDGPSWRLEHTRSGGAWSTRIVFADSIGDERQTVLKADWDGNDYGLDLDSQDHATWIDGFNQADPPLTSNANDLTVYPEFDADPTFDTPLQESLDQQTVGALAVRGEIAAVPSFTLLGETITAAEMRLGDSAQFHMDQGFITFHGYARVYGITYRVSQEAPLTRELALVPKDSAIATVMNATTTNQCPDCR